MTADSIFHPQLARNEFAGPSQEGRLTLHRPTTRALSNYHFATPLHVVAAVRHMLGLPVEVPFAGLEPADKTTMSLTTPLQGHFELCLKCTPDSR